MTTARRVVEVTGLRKSYGSRVALADVTFAVEASEVVGLLGPNGAGKTTTLSILATLLKPDTGSVRIAGYDASHQTADIRHHLGFVPQSIALYRALSARQNLELFLRVHGFGADSAREACTQALEAVGLAERAWDPVAILSGGMQRRLNLACGIAHRPEVLLLDEPTVGVDPQSREQILRTIRALADAGAGAIYSTHYMEEVERLCDRVVLIDRGTIVAAGTVAEVIAAAGERPRMEITFATQPPQRWYEGAGGIDEAGVTAEGRAVLRLANLAQVGELLERARAAGAPVRDFNVHSPNLSDAFMALTGHALRDGEPG